MNEILEWQCVTCHAIYAEYVNGCPKCWANNETLSKVQLQRPVELSAEAPHDQ
jgi:hypothetical protein